MQADKPTVLDGKPRVRLSIYCCVVLTIATVFSLTLLASGQQRPRQKRPAPKPAPATEPSGLSPREVLDKARNAEASQQRIDLLEKFLASSRGSDLENEARELLMREYALKGEQALREANPQAAMRAFKAAFRHAADPITDKVFAQYVFPLPMAMNAFGYRVESSELMRSFEPRFANDPNRLVEIGFFYVQIEAPFEAVRVLESAVQLAPQDHRAHNSLGTAYLISLRLDDAMAEFSRALELDSKDEFANLNIANLARAMGEYERAIPYYRRQIVLKHDDAEAHGGLAIALLALGRDEEAEPEMRRAMELAPGDYRFLTQLGFFYITRKKPSLARPVIEQAARIEPRYAWAFIGKAETDALEGKFGDALATLIGAQAHAGFATLTFELAKAFLAVDGYDQATEVMGKAFTVNADGEFEALLGGAIKTRSPRLDLLLERERQAALFLNSDPTTTFQYRLVEAICKISHFSKVALASRKPAQPTAARRRPRPGQAKSADASEDDEAKSATRPRRATAAPSLDSELSAGRDSNLPGMTELIRTITTFTTLDDGRQAFRMVWVSRKLTEADLALDAAELLARRAIDLAETATEPAGSMRDAPLLDRAGRRAMFLGRAYDALGWAQFKKGNTRAALESLIKSVDVYPTSLDRKIAIWHLAVATQEAGDDRRALELYIASYDPGLPTASVRRAQIEMLYKRLNGSLAGLEDKLKQQ
ncbi:MAG TPA: tetratricopeptide repeat protein [Blastocatellia bacterium]|nr:tetratricopeptide repeat protein [Blastocatellia bacterium]